VGVFAKPFSSIIKWAIFDHSILGDFMNILVTFLTQIWQHCPAPKSFFLTWKSLQQARPKPATGKRPE
jgi:hypothetical protein